MEKCSNCRFANRASNDDFVFCTYWQTQGEKSKLSFKAFVKDVMFINPSPQSVGFGWGYVNQRFREDGAYSLSSTPLEGLLHSNQVCIDKNDKCNAYKNI